MPNATATPAKSRTAVAPVKAPLATPARARARVETDNTQAMLNAIGRSQAIIEFDLEGFVLTANDNFLAAMGYTLDEIKSKHHSIFVDAAYRDSSEYKLFWDKLNRGEFLTGDYKRVGKGGREVWIQASYNPIFNSAGKPVKVVKFATDITAQKIKNANFESQLNAIGRAQAVIEFALDGTILSANDNFLNAMGYSLDEIQGQHHSLFVDPAYRESTEYKQFWAALNKGQFVAGEYRRLGKGGKEVWIQASYNPIFDLNGKPAKVVKFATDVTPQKMATANFEGQLTAIGRSQAVIEFNLDGTILAANDNFLHTMGYTIEEIKGKHHSLFVEPAYRDSAEYKQFWADLNAGKFLTSEFKRLGKNGKEVWISATYNPIFDLNGKPFKIVKFAHDATAAKLRNSGFESQLTAISRAQAVIEFDLTGKILAANDNFLKTMGYTLEEVQGHHHSIFVEPSYRESPAYKLFWSRLNRGEFLTDEYKRIGKGGREVWIQASYNPIFDLNGNPYKIVKFASDVTQQKLSNADFEGQITAISRSQAVIEFDLEGIILTANDNFLATMGYSLDEIQGKHHSLFVEPDYKESAAYKLFWARLNRGEFLTDEYKRLARGGREVWIRASYNPIFDLNGKPFKIVKFASDVTEQKLRNANFESQLTAISRAQAVIEFTLDGTILTANDNFLTVMGYTLEEIKGKHHGIFVDPTYRESQAYKQFWSRLNKGEFVSDEYRRLAKGGREVWIQANYNPILDGNGKPCKVVKFASDITEQKIISANCESQLTAISRAQAVIEFDLDGTILTANKNFLDTVGYTLEEIQGKHHSLFVESDYRESSAYKKFWERLRQGQFVSDEFKRVAKGGREVWIQASYNPIIDLNGKATSVVKFATDITQQKTRNSNFESQITAISRAQAVIEFDMNGIILTANDNFLSTLGYSLDEIKGRHHSMFVETAYGQSSAYKQFWTRLNQGQFLTDEYKRIAKGGREVWIQASYNPIFDLNGEPYKVVKFATDTTEQRVKNANFESQINAIGRAQAVIEFDLDGIILSANNNFLNAMGYTLDEIKGKHHSMFVDPTQRESDAYKQFWAKLNAGEFLFNEYKRFGKNGKEVWISASYNPIFDLNGKPSKVVKFATDVTQQKVATANFEGQINAISHAQAVIEFDLSGKILHANENFLKTMGYTLDEVKGQHHSMFVDPAYKVSVEYRDFWAKLNRGEFLSDEFCRVGKGGKEVWIQATYNPILDLNGKPCKVVKLAADITAQVDLRKQAEVQELREKEIAAALQTKVNSLLEVVAAAAQGDLTRKITVTGDDLAGQMARGLETLLNDLRVSVTSIGQTAMGVASSSEELSAISQQLTSSSRDAAKQANGVAASSDHVSANVSIVAASSEEMLVSIREISKSATEAARVAKTAVSMSDETNKTIHKLGISSQEIGKVVKVITSIAQQTNLLALNATIEAARAGEAGKGFAVVANEVKELAKETARATEEIGQKIEAIQADTNAAVKAIAQVGEIIEQVNDISSTIASAVEEQTATTNEIGRNVADAARGTSEIAQNIAHVARAAEQATAGARDTETAAAELTRMAAELQTLVHRFRL